MTIQQVNDEIAKFSRRVSTLKGLPDVQSQTTPLSSTVVQYYQSNIANGSGPNGTWLLSDFFGTAAGVPYNQCLSIVNTLIAQGISLGYFTTLKQAYDRMYGVVTDVYGPPPGIVIPAGAGAGSYATYDAALVALAAAANSAIGTIATTYSTFVAELNAAWQPMEAASPHTLSAKFTRAGVDWTQITVSELSTLAFISNIGNLGLDTQQGMSAQVFEGLANTSNAYGQALVGAMREGRNTAGITAAGIAIDNAIPSVPAAIPPQAPLLGGDYTVAEARAAS